MHVLIPYASQTNGSGSVKSTTTSNHSNGYAHSDNNTKDSNEANNNKTTNEIIHEAIINAAISEEEAKTETSHNNTDSNNTNSAENKAEKNLEKETLSQKSTEKSVIEKPNNAKHEDSAKGAEQLTSEANNGIAEKSKEDKSGSTGIS